MSGNERVRAVIQSVPSEANARVARIEQFKRFAILDRNLTQADGELTPMLKVEAGSSTRGSRTSLAPSTRADHSCARHPRR